MLRRKADSLKDFTDLSNNLGPLKLFMNSKGLADNIADRHSRIQRTVRVLKDNRNLLSQ